MTTHERSTRSRWGARLLVKEVARYQLQNYQFWKVQY